MRPHPPPCSAPAALSSKRCSPSSFPAFPLISLFFCLDYTAAVLFFYCIGIIFWLCVTAFLGRGALPFPLSLGFIDYRG